MDTLAKNLKRTTITDIEYELYFDDLYRWKNKKGTVAAQISGGFTGPDAALLAFNVYNASLEFIADKMSGDEDLEALTTKKELVGYAEAKGVEIPAKHKSVGAIKKFLQGGYANA